MSDYCENFAGYIVGKKTGSPALLVRLRCKTWSCSYCAEKNAEMWRANLLDKINKWPNDKMMNWYLMTLTSASWNRTATGSATALQENWNGIIQIYRNQAKTLGQKISYMRVFEAHKSGALHLHAIVHTVVAGTVWHKTTWDKRPETVNVKTVRLKDKLAKMPGMGWNCDVRRIEHGEGYKAALYVVKYLTKDAQDFHLPKNARRIATSRDLKMEAIEGRSQYEWRHFSDFLERDMWEYIEQCGSVVMPQTGTVLNNDMFDENGKLLYHTQ